MKNNSFNKIPLEEQEKTLKYSVIEGSLNSSAASFGDSFFSAFALLLGATNMQLSILASLPITLGSFLELYSSKLLKYFSSRKSFVIFGMFMQSLMLIPIALVFYFGVFRVYHLIIFISFYFIFGMIIIPVWSSWIGDIINPKERGAYFGSRTEILSIASFISLIIAGYLLDNYSFNESIKYKGFFLIFGIALFLKIASIFFIYLHYEPKYNNKNDENGSFKEFIINIKKSNFGIVVLFLSLMNFAVYIPAPFFTAYMLNDLKFDYFTFTLVTVIAVIIRILATPVWGDACDIYGSKNILIVSSFLMPLTPLLWLFSTDYRFLMIVQIYSGFIWAGFDMASLNILFDSTSPQERVNFISYFHAINGFFILVGSILGAIIVKYNSVFWSKYLFVFFISFILRYAVSFAFSKKLKDITTVEKVSYRQIFVYVLTSIPNRGHINKLIHLNHNSEKEDDKLLKLK